MIKLGIDRIHEYANLFKGKRIGLITNYSGVTSNLEDNLTAFIRSGYQVERLFTPEHGLYGALDGAEVGNGAHPVWGTPIVSLFGEKRQPSPEDLAGLDLLVYDIQDVGLRYYTYIYTLANCMQAAENAGLPVVVLDRPNPLGGKVSGNRMDPRYDSFVGAHGLATRYGMTCGEVGHYFHQYLKLGIPYEVVPMEGYRRDMTWPETGQLWNIPSPSIHTFQSIQCYVGGCFFEATNLSEGRGTAEPFQIYGAPFINMDKLVKELHARIHDDRLAFRTRAFTPYRSKYADQTCYGVEFIPLSDQLDFMKPALITMRTIKDMYPDHFAIRQSTPERSALTTLSGDQSAEAYINGRLTLDELMEQWDGASDAFEKEIQPLRIY